MTVKVSDVMREINHAFPKARWHGSFTLSDGKLAIDELLPGDWIAVHGSDHMDGVHHLDEAGRIPDARDERFTGAVWLLAPSADFLRLCEEIGAWAEAQRGAVRSERFGAYSVEYQTGQAEDWRSAFAAQLRPYRRMWTEVPLC